MTMGRALLSARTDSDFTGAEAFVEIAACESFEFTGEFGGFAFADSSGRSNEMIIIAPRKLSTDTRPW